MSVKNKFCANCGAAVEGKEFCPQCGAKQSFDAATPQETPSSPSDKVAHEPSSAATPQETPSSPSDKVSHEQSRGAMEHLNIAFNVAMNNPLVFLPAILSGIIGGIIGFISPLAMFAFLGTILWLINLVISYILSFASTDMSRDAYTKQPLDLGSSISYVFSRIVPFLIAAIFGMLLSITIVLIPVVILTFVIMVVDETEVFDALGKAFNVIKADLGDIIIVIIVAIVGFAVTSMIPLVSSLLYSILNVVIGLAFIDIYMNFKNR
jgi:hypothetical protein